LATKREIYEEDVGAASKRESDLNTKREVYEEKEQDSLDISDIVNSRI
jgi:hypothetical protein